MPILTALSLVLLAPRDIVVLDVTQFGASASPGEDTAAFQAAFDKARTLSGCVIRVPAGTFELRNTFLYGNTQLEGVGPASVIRTVGGQFGGMIVINSVHGEGAKTRPNEENIQIRNLMFRGEADTQGKKEHDDLVRLLGTKNVTIENCDFVGFRGDGIYIGDGNAERGVVRHNYDVTVRNCRFDGLVRKNRNGITVGDGTNVTIQNCTFREIGLTGIDIEQNKQPNHYCRQISVLDCRFTDNDGSAIVVDLPKSQQEMEQPAKDLIFKRNVIKNQKNRAILLNQNAPWMPGTLPVGAQVMDNEIDTATQSVTISGIQGVTVSGNKIRNVQRGIQVGYGKLGATRGVTIERNEFTNVGTDPKFGGAPVVIFGALDVAVRFNTVLDTPGDSPSLLLFANAKNAIDADRITVQGNSVSWQRASSKRNQLFRAVNGVVVPSKAIREIE